MGEKMLWEIYLEERVQDLNKVVLYHGIYGILSDFESWLHEKVLIDIERAYRIFNEEEGENHADRCSELQKEKSQN